MDVTIAIPTYFGNRMLTNCVDSIMKNVKNAKVVVFKNDIGWLQACNKLMFQNMPFGDVLILNDDTLIVSDIVEAMREAAYSDDKIGIVGGMALAPDGATVINFGIYIAADGSTAHLYYGKNADAFDKIESRRAVEGSCMYIKREVIEKIGLFDEKYGMGYREEVDYCFRAKEAGYKIVSTPAAKYIHFVSQTNGPLGITNDTHKYFMSKWGTKLKLGEI
jgi:GT2 family glycosyltransferase